MIEDSTIASQIKALSISGKADSVLALLPDEIPKIIADQENILSDSAMNNPTEEINAEPIEELLIENTTLNADDVFSKDFVPPTLIKENIFFTTEREVYSDENPIPVNPKLPKGLIYKVQVGAFRNPIPQNLFKGFAPIS